MPRKPRYFLPNIPAHIVQRGHSRSPVFFENDDYHTYLHYLDEGSKRYECAIHAYVLMTNHIHILATPSDKEAITRMMQYVGRYYVPYINYKYGSSGSIWEGRYKANLVQDDGYLLTCMRYIELNPVRADMTKSPRAYRWSSYKQNALGKEDLIVTAHDVYKQLGRNAALRQENYRDLFKAQIEKEQLSDIRAAWQTGTPLGNSYFKELIEKKLKCKVGQARRGRPSKLVGDDGKGL